MLRPTRAPVSLPAETAQLPQAGQGCDTAIGKATLYLATQCPSWADDLRLIDGTPVPCGAPRETAKRFELAGFANYGNCAAHSR
ncbi:hypothetical protein MGAST_28140 [Mycobacterium gastri 'Wayne']|nr:hypothetical protein MGAST_28140 [Mycobacterium gastri 'Wayne']